MQLFFIIIGNVFNWAWYVILIPLWLSIHYLILASIIYLVVGLLLTQYNIRKKR